MQANHQKWSLRTEVRVEWHNMFLAWSLKCRMSRNVWGSKFVRHHSDFRIRLRGGDSHSVIRSIRDAELWLYSWVRPLGEGSCRSSSRSASECDPVQTFQRRIAEREEKSIRAVMGMEIGRSRGGWKSSPARNSSCSQLRSRRRGTSRRDWTHSRSRESRGLGSAGTCYSATRKSSTSRSSSQRQSDEWPSSDSLDWSDRERGRPRRGGGSWGDRGQRSGEQSQLPAHRKSVNQSIN